MTTIKSVSTVLLIVLCLFSTLAWAETVYKSIDSQGNITFSDKPMPGAAQVQIVQVTPRNSPQKKQEVQKLEQQLATNNQPAANTQTAATSQAAADNQQAQQDSQQRQQLLQQLKIKYAQLHMPIRKACLAMNNMISSQLEGMCVEISSHEVQQNFERIRF